MVSSIYALTVSLNTAGTISTAAVVSGGTGYTAGNTITLTGVTSGSSDATATATVSAGVMTSYTIVLAGTNYINGESLTVTGGTGNDDATGTATTVTIAADSDILSSDISISTDQLRPGGGGVIRLTFAFSLPTTPATISVFNGGVLKGDLNADNSTNIISDGYYRFDIDVEAGDTINIQSSEIVDVIRFVRAHLVLVGA